MAGFIDLFGGLKKKLGRAGGCLAALAVVAALVAVGHYLFFVWFFAK